MLSLLLTSMLTFVELNCENLFDTQHDSLRQDTEYTAESTRHWTRKRYWRKLNNIAQELISCCDDGIPDLIALCEVENDTVLHDLTRRSLLRNAGYEYLMTQSPDLRGIDVALLYSPFAFSPLNHHSIRVTPLEGMRPTRDILYVSGRLVNDDTLHVFVVHAPSRYGGEHSSRPFRLQVADALVQAVDSVSAVSPDARIVVAGDFNDYAESPALKRLYQHGLSNATASAASPKGVKGTYRYKGDWQHLDHVLLTDAMAALLADARIHAPQFLLENEPRYGGQRPRRTYNGYRYQPGYSDHLPLVLRFRIDNVP